MYIMRIFPALLPATVVTFLLLLLMHFLVEGNMTEPKSVTTIKIPDILMPDRKITTEYDKSKPSKPEEVSEPPPELPQQNFEAPDVQSDISYRPKIAARVEVGGLGGFNSDGDYLPIVKVAAKYPFRALHKGLEGYCVVEYTVTSTGETRGVQIVDCPEEIFASVSLKAAEKFKYKPKVVDGEAIEVVGVRNRFTFEMAKNQP